METLVLSKLVPDTGEELTVAGECKSLDTGFLRFKLSDPDEHALEETLLPKEKLGGRATAVALDGPEVDDVLFRMEMLLYVPGMFGAPCAISNIERLR